MIFDETYKRLLASGELGLLSKREKVMREVWNSAIQSSLDACEGQPDHDDCVREIEKLKA